MRGLHFGSCLRLAGMHVGSKWDGVLGVLDQTGKLGWQVPHRSAIWELGMLRWAGLEDSVLGGWFLELGFGGEWEREEGRELMFIKALC